MALVMLIAHEIHALHMDVVRHNQRQFFVRIDIDQKHELENFLAHHDAHTTPVLTKYVCDKHASQWDQDFFQEIIEQYSVYVQNLVNNDVKRIVLALDDDSILQKILSPRYCQRDFKEKIKFVKDLYLSIKNPNNDVVILSTIEELAPGGFDATDGIKIAQELERVGLKEIITASGTKDFIALYDRRATSKKPHEQHEFLSHEPHLASALWVLAHTTLAVWCLAKIDNYDHASDLATKLGLAGLIDRAQKDSL